MMKMMTVSWPSSQQDQLQGSWSDQSLLPLSSHKQTCSSKVGNWFCDLETGILRAKFLKQMFWISGAGSSISCPNSGGKLLFWLLSIFLWQIPYFVNVRIRSSKHVHPDYDDAYHPLLHHFRHRHHKGHLSGAPLIEEATEDMLMIWPAVSKYFNFDLI